MTDAMLFAHPILGNQRCDFQHGVGVIVIQELLLTKERYQFVFTRPSFLGVETLHPGSKFCAAGRIDGHTDTTTKQ